LECCCQYFLFCGIRFLLVKPNAIVVWVAHLPYVQEDLGWNVKPETCGFPLSSLKCKNGMLGYAVIASSCEHKSVLVPPSDGVLSCDFQKLSYTKIRHFY
jgi:hypothetical protein